MPTASIGQIETKITGSVENLPIRWSEPRGGLRLGALFVVAKKDQTPRFRKGDQAAMQLFVQNMTKQRAMSF